MTLFAAPLTQALVIYAVLTRMHGMSAQTQIGLSTGASRIKHNTTYKDSLHDGRVGYA